MNLTWKKNHIFALLILIFVVPAHLALTHLSQKELRKNEVNKASQYITNMLITVYAVYGLIFANLLLRPNNPNLLKVSLVVAVILIVSFSIHSALFITKSFTPSQKKVKTMCLANLGFTLVVYALFIFLGITYYIKKLINGVVVEPKKPSQPTFKNSRQLADTLSTLIEGVEPFTHENYQKVFDEWFRLIESQDFTYLDLVSSYNSLYEFPYKLKGSQQDIAFEINSKNLNSTKLEEVINKLESKSSIDFGIQGKINFFKYQKKGLENVKELQNLPIG